MNSNVMEKIQLSCVDLEKSWAVASLSKNVPKNLAIHEEESRLQV
jgi:hypothetical protein